MEIGRRVTARIWREGDWFVAQACEIDIASQGETEAQARENLREAVELFFKCASTEEIADRYHPAEQSSSS